MGNSNDPPPSNNANNNDKPNNQPNNGPPFNNSGDELLNLLGNTFITNDGLGDKTFAKGIAPNQVIGLYFSAHWCPPCRKFTPHLKQLHDEWKKQNHKIEIVFVSGDKDYASFKSYFNDHHGNWLALPFGSAQIGKVNQKFQVRGIPSLIFLDSFGNVVEQNGRDLVQSQGVNAIHHLLKNLPDTQAKAFQGTGHSLKSANNDNNKGDTVSMYDYITRKETKLFDDEDEVATMQIVLSDGSKKTVKMNMNKQNVGDLFAHIKWLNDPGPFQLLAGFPPKVLKDETMTVKDAELKGARITQKKI
eukprot:1090768_1